MKLVKIEIITLFPGMFKGFLDEALIKQAVKKKVIDLDLIDLRKFALDKHGTCDDSPYGGGPGMVLKCEPLFRAVEKIKRKNSYVLLMTPQGKTFTQVAANRLAKKKHLIIICGRYEGIDHRVTETLVDEEISIGDFVTSGGELPAMIIMESVVRLIPGAISKRESYEKDSFYQGLLDWPHYTRPAVFKGLKAPKVLLSGDHAKIQRWRQKQAEKITRKNRPDLWLNIKTK